MKRSILYGLEAATGGALKHVVYLATRMDRGRFDITLALSDLRDKEVWQEIKKLRALGIRIVIIPMKRQIAPFSDLLAFVKIYRLIRQHRFDLVHAHSSKAGALFRLAAWLNNTPQIFYTPHCFYFQGQTGWRKKIFQLMEKVLAKCTHSIIVSDNERKAAIQTSLCSVTKIRNINNAIDFNDYGRRTDKAALRAAYSFPAQALVIGGIGRLEKQKNFELFIQVAKEICRRYNNVFFVVAGDGSERGKLAESIHASGLSEKVRLTGYIDNIHEIYSIIDIYLSTSLWEGLPYTLLEAAYFKKPILTTYGSDFEEVLCEEAAPAAVKDVLVSRIVRLINNKKLMIEAGMNNRGITEKKHSFLRFIEEHEQLYSRNSR